MAHLRQLVHVWPRGQEPEEHLLLAWQGQHSLKTRQRPLKTRPACPVLAALDLEEAHQEGWQEASRQTPP